MHGLVTPVIDSEKLARDNNSDEELNRAIKTIHRVYGRNLSAFFNDVAADIRREQDANIRQCVTRYPCRHPGE